MNDGYLWGVNLRDQVSCKLGLSGFFEQQTGCLCQHWRVMDALPMLAKKMHLALTNTAIPLS
jgi:hypothetical protein